MDGFEVIFGENSDKVTFLDLSDIPKYSDIHQMSCLHEYSPIYT